MGITANIDISAEQRQLILALFNKHLPNTQVWAFGSRVKWTTRSNSDLDLVAFSTPQQEPQISALKEAFEESNLPFRVDLLVWDNLPENFQRNIRESYEVLVADNDVKQDTVISSGWPIVKLDDVIELITGFPFKSNEYSDDGNGYKLLRGDNIVQGHFRWEDVKLLPKTKIIDKHQNYWLKDGDVILAMDRPWIEAGLKYAQVTAIDLPCLLVQRTSCLRAKRGFYQDFLRYLISSYDFVEYIKLVQTGTAVPHISSKQILDFEFCLPPEYIQIQIGKILRSLDSKIEINRQTNQTLEQIAQAIFKSWFVDFEPVKAKMAAKQAGASAEQIEQAAICAISGKTPEQLAQLDPQTQQQLKATAALFPDALVDSELGEIPEGWGVVRFSQIVEKYIDNRGKTPPIVDSGIPLLEVKHLPDHSIKPDVNTDKFVDDETYESWFRAHLNSEDLIISTVGTIGRLCMVPNGMKMAIAQNLLGLRFNREIASPYFMYYLMDGKRYRDDVNNRLVITVQASIKRQDLETIDLLSPPIALQNQFEFFVRPFVEMQQSDENERLGKLRDTLLPKLLSGEISVNSESTALQETL